MIIEVIFVSSAVPGIGAALGDDLNLGACGAVEVRSLVGGIDFEFFHTVERCGHDAGRASAKLTSDNATGRIASEARSVNRHTTVHIVRILATVEHESALVDN